MSSEHVIQKTSLLLSFEVARKLTSKDVKEIKTKISNSNVKKGKKREEFEKEMEKYTSELLQKEVIPGLINQHPQGINPLKTQELLKYSIYLGKEIKKLKLSKAEESFIVVSLVKLLELGIKDFKKWMKQNREKNDSQEDDTNDE